MRKNTIIALLVLLLGVGSAFSISSPRNKKQNGSIVTFTTSTTGVDPRFFDTDEIFSGTNESAISENNVIKKYAEEIAKLNSGGQGTDKSVRMPTDETLTKIIEGELAKPIPVTLYTEKDIIVTKSVEKKDKLVYASAVDAAVRKTIGSAKTAFAPSLVQLVSNNNPANLIEYATAISSYIQLLLAIPVPETLKTFHLGLINVMQKQLTNINEIVRSGDPKLVTVVALNNLLTLVDEEYALYKSFSKL